VIGPEGASSKTLLKSDLVVKNVDEALDIISNPKRIIASLRE
jgi:soluble P-type ATPase